jgi:glycosyltransferase involved in cell wall biosynthesis
MRILLLGDLPPFVLGGAERQLLLLAQEWRDAGHEVLVLGHRTPSGTHAGVPARRIRVVYRLGRLVRGATFALSLAWNLIRGSRRTNVIYCRFLGEAAIVVAAMKFLRCLRVPLVVVPAASGQGAHSDLERLRASRLWPLIRSLLREVQVFNAISPAIRDELQNAKLGPITGIANGVRLPERVPARSAPLSAERFWLFCGRLVQQKGVDLLLEAMAMQPSVNMSLLIAGEGPDESALRAASHRLGIARRVSFLGRVPHEELLATMRRAYALVLPSRYEGLSNAALEALGTGLPVLCTECGGIDAYLGDGIGWVCKANPASLAAALDSAARISDSEWAQRSRRGRALAEQSFAIDNCAAQHLILFAQLAQGRIPTPGDMPSGNSRASLPR